MVSIWRWTDIAFTQLAFICHRVSALVYDRLFIIFGSSTWYVVRQGCGTLLYEVHLLDYFHIDHIELQRDDFSCVRLRQIWPPSICKAGREKGARRLRPQNIALEYGFTRLLLKLLFINWFSDNIKMQRHYPPGIHTRHIRSLPERKTSGQSMTTYNPWCWK